MSLHTSRINNFLSSSECLCGILTSGDCLALEHLRIMMAFVNVKSTFDGQYYSSKNCWNDAPPTLKIILNILDDEIINNQLVFVVCPIIVPLNPDDTLRSLEKLPYEIIREC